MNIALGKLARAINFDDSKWGIIGGDEMPRALFFNIARKYPEHNFYIIGRNNLGDFKKTTSPSSNINDFLFGSPEELPNEIDVPSNLYSIYDELSEFTPINYGTTDLLEWQTNWITNDLKKKNMKKDAPHIVNYFNFENKMLPEIMKRYKFDLAILIYGPISNYHIPHITQVMDKSCPKEGYKNWNSPLAMLSNYAGQMIKIVNEQKCPVVCINEDPRYLSNTFLKDMVNIEKVVLSQINVTMDRYYLNMTDPKSKSEDCFKTSIDHVYAKPETIFLMEEEKIDFREMDKTNKFIMTINGGGDRYKIIRDWIFKHDDSTMINGKWDEADILDAEYKNRFILTPISEMQPEMWNSRYTLIAPMKNTKFVTQKFWKMIYYGIIPFMHPDYDQDNLLQVPDVLRPKTPEQMWNVINYLDENPDEYRKLLGVIYKILSDDLFSGKEFFDILNKNLEKYVGFTL